MTASLKLKAGVRRWLAIWLADRRRARQSPSVSPPAAPSNLNAVAEDEMIALSWQDNSGDEQEFRIYRKEFSGPYSLVGIRGANVVTYFDVNAEPGVTYTYYVAAYNAGGESAPSNEASAGLSGE